MSIRDVVYNAPLAAFGKREGQNPDWFNANLQELESAIETINSALLTYKKSSCVKTLAALKMMWSNAQTYCLTLCQ